MSVIDDFSHRITINSVIESGQFRQSQPWQQSPYTMAETADRNLSCINGSNDAIHNFAKK